MKRYRVILNGQNFSMDNGNGAEKIGFYTTRWVKAESPEKAELAAVELVKNDSSLKHSVQNEKSDPPTIFLEELSEVGWFEFFRRNPGGGYTFYPENGEK
jgi:hypothetical protein